MLIACVAGACIYSEDASGQAGRDSALTALRAAATAGNVDAELALAGLLDQDSKTRNDEALGWYEKAARSGSRVAQRRYLEMLSRPAAQATVPLRAFTIRLPKSSLGEDDPPPDIPPGYHCHPLGNQTMWCHGASDGRP
ncbi:MAG: hypothetical protein M3N82_01050 [Pseudomonadota bacterium]|nr:hypothetical protein [Pseudomonadota bacterium]